MGWLNRLYTVDILSDRRMYHKCYTNINMHALVLYAALDGSDAEGLLPLQLYAIAVLTNFSPPRTVWETRRSKFSDPSCIVH